MNATMHGKKIEAVWWPDNATETGRNLSSKEGIELELSVTYHGDHDEIWIIEKSHGAEIARHNPRFVESIIWGM